MADSTAFADGREDAIRQRRALLSLELTRIRDVLAKVPSVRQLLVFGSVASGQTDEWSDLDLMVVQETTAPFLERSRILAALTKPRVGTQFLVYTPNEITRIAQRPFVRHEILEKGKAVPMNYVEEAGRWLTFAGDDLRMAELAYGEEIWSQVCFHAQQCAEKCLKAMLARTGDLLPRTHVLADLWAVQPPPSRDALGDLAEQLVALDRFYIPTRYPDALPGALPEGMPNRDEATEALASARTCLERTRRATVASS
ncbi:MAG: HEPN domain-containing protein [Vicinamibacterales bacterium]